MRYQLYAASYYHKAHRLNWPLCKIYTCANLLWYSYFLIVLDQTFKGGGGKWFQGGECMTPNVILRESDLEEEMY